MLLIISVYNFYDILCLVETMKNFQIFLLVTFVLLFTGCETINKKSDQIAKEENFIQLKSLLNNKNIQPRLIDYYVTQFSKNHPEFFVNAEYVSDVYNSYKVQLKSFHKRCFNLFEKKKIITIKLMIN